eukprot:166242-Prorocentrum_minimum.AAC.2
MATDTTGQFRTKGPFQRTFSVVPVGFREPNPFVWSSVLRATHRERKRPESDNSVIVGPNTKSRGQPGWSWGRMYGIYLRSVLFAENGEAFRASAETLSRQPPGHGHLTRANNRWEN